MNRNRLALCAALLLFLLGPGCGGGDDPVEPDPVTLEGATLGQPQATSLAPVYLVGLPRPDAPQDYEVILSVDGQDDVALPVEADGTGPFFHAPLHPATPNAGGSVTVRISDGVNLGPARELVVDALPPAPGAFGEFVALLRAHVQQRAQWAGTSFEELAALDFDAVPPMQLPLKTAQYYLESPEPGHLAGLVDNTLGFLSADERELLDRLLGYARVDSLIQAEIDTFATGNPAPPARPGPRADRRICVDAGPPISTAAQLSQAMLASALADVAINPASAPGRTLDALGTVLLGGSVLPVYGKAFSTLGAGVAAWASSAEFVRGIFPNRLTALNFDFDTPQFDEDEDTPGKWSNVRVIAVSDGWSADAAVANAVTNKLSAGLTLPRQLRVRELGYLKSAAMAGFNAGLKDYIDEQGGLDLCPQTWDIDITGQPWSTAQVLDARFSVDPATLEVRPLAVGSDVLRVAAQPSQFGGREVEEDLPIRTLPISVNLSPDDYTVEQPGEVVSLTATIANAKDQTLEWTITGNAAFNDGLPSETDGGATRGVATSADPRDYPIQVMVESTSGTGLRSSGTPRRLAFATIRFNDEVSIEIEPAYVCISPGETQQFEAVVTGLEDYTVVWEIAQYGYGSIDQNGLYTSVSGGSSNATIVATLEGIEDISAEADIDAGACNCFADIQVAGGINWSRQTSQIAYLVSEFEDLFYQFFVDIGSDDYPAVSMALLGSEELASPRPGDTGTWPIGFSLVTASGTWTSLWGEGDANHAWINITQLTETSMEGTISGTAARFNPDGSVMSEIVISVDMKAGRWDGAWPCE